MKLTLATFNKVSTKPYTVSLYAMFINFGAAFQKAPFHTSNSALHTVQKTLLYILDSAPIQGL